MQRVREAIATLAVLPRPVRLEGPTGSGKGVAARMLHARSPRAGIALIVCSLANIGDSTALDELLGHRRGAFTGAVEDRSGLFEDAHHGTLFLDEVGEASPQVQRNLLRLLDEQVTCRLGERRDRPVDVRVILATNRDLEAEVGAGRFREDLFARVEEFVVRMPSLSEHPEDIPELVDHLLPLKCQELQRTAPPLTPAHLDQLMAYTWPRNVRQLAKVIEHYVVFGCLSPAVQTGARPRDWRRHVRPVLERHGGNVKAAARELGVARQTLHEELRLRTRP